MRKEMKKVVCAILLISFMIPTSVQAAVVERSTQRIPNDPIDISSTQFSYDLRDENDVNVWEENGTVQFEGSPLTISVYPTIDNGVLPTVSYSLSIEGDNVKKELIKEGRTEVVNVYNDMSYVFQDKYADGTILAGPLLPIYPVCKRLGMERGHVEACLFPFLNLSDEYTLEELRSYSSMTEFIDKTGFMKSDEVYENVSPGYITALENTALDKAKQWGFSDVESYLADLCAKEEYAKCELVQETWYPVYYIVSKDLVSYELAKQVTDKRNYTLLEKDNYYYLKGTSSDVYLDYLEYDTRKRALEIAKELNIESDQLQYSYKEEPKSVYHTYYDFTERQLIEAIAAEMDVWSGRWDSYLYGDEHFNYWYESEKVNMPGYYFGNWGEGFGVIYDQMEVVFEPEYKYTITGPGSIAITITGREDQNGYSSVNLRGKKTVYLNVTSNKQGGWKKDSNGWLYQNSDGTYAKNQWKSISGSWYYFGGNGYMYEQGWHWINGKCYYMYSDGTMASDTWIEGSYVDTSGVWIQEKWMHDSNGWWYQNVDGTYPKNQWKSINGNWYYFGGNGYMYEQGWHWINGKCYYMYSDGSMALNTWIGGSYVDASGVWVQGKWMHDSKGWWYRNPDGTYAKNQWKSISGSWYYFGENGYMYEQGWHWINGKCYYMYSNGKMASNTWIEGSYVDASGVWVQ